LTPGHYNFSRLLNPDWSIQISRAPAVCKESVVQKINDDDDDDDEENHEGLRKISLERPVSRN